ncbi:MAG: HAMP domain-containing histidine kinase [Candidatus Heimdallarchaeota archaeon]|nr:MAG: HAMP domain-containing histidine kinase [Candidatus Heimdallarchaeota archaeon]
MDIDPIALSAATSAFIAFIAAFTLLYDWYATSERPRLEWGIGMMACGVGGLIGALMYSVLEPSIFMLFIHINLSGAITMGFMLYGTLILFDPDVKRAKLISFGFGCFFTIGTFLFGFVIPTSLPITPVLLGEPTNTSMMLWFGVETIVPVSILIAYLMFVDLRATQNIASFWISLHFFLYAVLLFLWPFDDDTLKLLFYIGRAFSIAAILVGVRELGRKKVYTQLIREAKAESAFLMDIITHDIKGYVHGSKMLLDYGITDKESQNMIFNNLMNIDSLVKRVRRYKAIDRFQESLLTPLDLVVIIENNVKGVRHSFPQNSIDYKIHLDPDVEKFEILGNEFLDDLFLNIFHNAVKHHRNRPEVYFSITIKDMPIEDSWQIIIEDDGPGIPEDQVKTLFSISKEKSPKSEKGLGHLITRKAVQWYNGKIWAENRIEDDKIVGATVYIMLPKYRTEPKRE